jgi:hypothetical protein
VPCIGINQLHGTENRLYRGPRAAELVGRPILALFGAKGRASWLRWVRMFGWMGERVFGTSQSSAISPAWLRLASRLRQGSSVSGPRWDKKKQGKPGGVNYFRPPSDPAIRWGLSIRVIFLAISQDGEESPLWMNSLILTRRLGVRRGSPSRDKASLLNLKVMSNIYVRPTVFDENFVCLSLTSWLKEDLKSSKSKHQQQLSYAHAHWVFAVRPNTFTIPL